MNYRLLAVVTAVGVLLACAANAGGKPELKNFSGVNKVMPVKAAKIGPDFKMQGKWMKLGGGIKAQAQTDLAWDCFEPDASGVPSEVYTPNCGLGSNRWYFGAGYSNPFNCNDMTVVAGANGQLSERMETIWYNDLDEPDFYMAHFTTEDFDDTCAGPAYANAYDGIVLSFGAIGFGGWYTDVDLTGSGLSYQLPMDGSGGLIEILAQAFDGTTFTLCSSAQPMLWGIKSGNPYGAQGPIQWDDDAPTDGTWTAPDECYDYTYGVCPDPLAAGNCFYYAGGGGGPEVVNVSAVAVLKGTYNSGDVNSFTADDDNYYVVGAQYDPTDPLAVINATVRLDGHSSASSYTSGKFKVTEKCNTTQAKYRVRLVKAAGGFAVVVDNVATSFTETTFDSTMPTPISDFILTSDNNRLRTEARAASNNKLAGFFRYSVDLANWTLTP